MSNLPRNALFLAVITTISSAQAEQKVLELDTLQVVSTATRTEQAIQDVSASVIVISQQDIERKGAHTLKDIFNSTPGLTLQYGTFPNASSASKSSVSLRGVGATGTLWLLDGRRLAGEVKNPYDMDRIPASSIDRIEIVKGPMSALYGADAVGGVINIITKKPVAGELKGEVSLGYGSNSDGEGDQGNFSAGIRGGKETVRFSLNVSQQSSDPYTETEATQTRLGSPMTPPPLAGVKPSYDVPVSYREESDVTTIGGRIDVDFSETTTLGLEANWFDEEREGTYRGSFHPTGFSPAPGKKVPAFDVPVRSTDENTRTDVALDLNHEMNEQLDIQGRIYQSKYEKRNTTTLTEFADFAYPSETASSASGMTANVTIRALETSATWYSPNDRHTVIGGFEIRDEEREATVFTQSNDLTKREVGSKAAFIQDEWRVTDQTRLTFGGRYDSYTQEAYKDALGTDRDESTDSKSTFRIGLNHEIREGLNVRANIAQGYRIPDIRELFIQKQTPAGMQLGAQTVDPMRGKTAYDLQPESTDAFEIGVSGQQGQLSYDVALFRNNIEDRIQQIQVGAGQMAYYTFQNLSKATTQGIEVNLDYQVNEQITLGLAWSELDTENKETGKDLEFTPERSIGLSADWKVNNQLNVGAQMIYTGEQYYREQMQDMKTDAFTLVDVNASYALGKNNAFEIYGGIRNVTDEDVEKRLGSNPGRFFHAGVRYRF